MHLIKGILSLLWKLYIGLVFCVIAVVMYPLFLVVLISPALKKLSFKLFIFWSWLMRILCFYPIKKITKSPLPEGPYIVVANHASYLDIFILYSILPKSPFVFLGKSEILKYPILRTYFKNLNIPVYRNDRTKAGQSYVAATKAIEDGWSLVIFPEGTIPDDHAPRMIPFKAGAFKLAKTLDIPILPLTFLDNYKLFSDPTNILGPARPGLSRICIHPLITREEIRAASIKEMSDHCFSIISEPIMKEHPELY